MLALMIVHHAFAATMLVTAAGSDQCLVLAGIQLG